MRLIDADALKKVIETYRPIRAFDDFSAGKTNMVNYCLDEIDNAPTVDTNDSKYLDERDADAWESGYIQGLSEQRPQGKWIKIIENLSWHYECNQCHNRPLMARLVDEDVLSDFCPNCGADMRGEEK